MNFVMTEKASEMSGKLTENQGDEEEIEDIVKECIHCGNHPCVSFDLQPSLASILETYGEWKTKKQVRYLMYCEAVREIFGTGLGKGVRKKVPTCVENMIRKMQPDKEYTGFVPSKGN